MIFQCTQFIYFINIGKRISESMNAGHHDHYQYMKGNYVNSLFFAPVSCADVEEIILFLEISQVISIQSQLLF